MTKPPRRGGESDRWTARERSRRWLVAAVATLLVLSLAAAALVQGRQAQLLNQTTQYQDDYLQVSLNQLEIEYLRLYDDWKDALAQGTPASLAALQLRYEIFVSRIALLDVVQASRVMHDKREFEATSGQLRSFVQLADAHFGPDARVRPGPDALRGLMPALEALNQPIHTLSIEASHRVSEQVAQRNEAVRQHNRVGIALTGLLSVITLAFAYVSMRQTRRLQERQRGLEELATRLRQARREAEAANRTKSEFLANMSHEIRTPFQGLLGMLSLLRDSPLGARQLDYLRTAIDSADHLLVILNDILDMSKLESGTLRLHPEAVDARRLVADVEALMRPQAMAKDLELRVTVDPALPPRLLVDATRVRQVLFNLASNAIKFCERGSVTLELGLEGTDRLQFTVTDTGVGMDEATQARLFQRFTQGDQTRSRRHGGTGLGLEISRNLARLMGGDIAVRSQPGVGSSFSFSLPLVPAPELPAPPARSTPPDAPGVPRRLRVLAAEDHPVNCKYLAALLDRLGHDVVFADNGWEALQAVQAQDFDLVLMDLHMPVMDGVAATQAIRALDAPAAGVPIIALTADAFAETRERCLAAGMTDFLSKPVSLQELAATLARRLGVPADASAAVLAAPPATPGGAGALLDARVLADVLSVMPRERFAALAEGYLRDSLQMLARMREALLAREPDALRAAAHGTKGAALNLGLRAVAQAAQVVQQAAAEGQWTALPALVQALQSAFEATELRLREEGLLEQAGAATA